MHFFALPLAGSQRELGLWRTPTFSKARGYRHRVHSEDIGAILA
jgi:hypothetical protein